MYHLADAKVLKTKTGLKITKLTDGGGLYLHIATSGSKLWRFQYRFDGKLKLMALGKYPDVTLKQARERHLEARHLLAKGVDLMVDRKAQKVEDALDAKQTTFKDIFNLWVKWWREGKDEEHAARVERRMFADVISAFGSEAMDDITAADIRNMMLTIAERGANDIARRCHETTSQVFRFVIARGYANENPTVHFKPSDIVRKPKVKNFARVPEMELPALLVAMDRYNAVSDFVKERE